MLSASEPIIKRSLIDGEEEEKIISVEFTVPEYNRDGTFKLAKYSYQAEEDFDNPKIDKGWKIFRNDEKMLSVEDGYVIVTGKYCGICSTDLARRFLPFPLPQIIGHEAVAIHKSKPVVIEINASHYARGIHKKLNPPCSFCQHGFAPYILAPKNALIPIPENLSLKVASLAEPFAAALHAVETTPPINGQEVAVLGPRKLGMLIIAALNGFLQSIKITKKILHLKSTHGQNVCGLNRMTDFVVEELNVNNSINDILEWIDQLNKGQVLDQNLKNSPVPRFDLVVIGNLKEIDSVIRPKEGMDLSILRSRGAILYAPSEPPPSYNDNNEIQLLSKALIDDDIQIWSTRCGNLKNSLKGLSKNLEITNILEKNMITKEITLENLDEGFDLAMSGDHIKILVDVEAKNTI
ncbi:77_t:CDS:2 [Diversispora eburnea]|uniref:77_t:CDS:1 n=1 Tax=Diversispora eburnea TaxID=1213867 RepID=A0A9N9B4V6_9GLOM|nr:77_t:CDS:2 [Diversispora eburnea]